MRAILTAVGNDRVGIIAALCRLLADNNVNILDISQTILQEKFTMFMAVDVGDLPCSFTDLAAQLDALAAEMGISIRIQRQEIPHRENRGGTVSPESGAALLNAPRRQLG